MKALTICQPYAHLICLPESHPQHKRVENRTWPTSHRGPIAIHAGKSKAWLVGEDVDGISESQLVFGAVVAIADLVACIHVNHKREFDRFPWLASHRHALGPWCWVLMDVRVLPKPVPYKGAQGIWEIPDGLECSQ